MNQLALYGVAETLRDIARREATGVVRVGAGGRLRMAFFERGELVYLVSDAPEENLAAYFARAGRLESAEARLSLFRLEKEAGRQTPLVGLLVDRGVVEAEQLRGWLVEYASDVFGRIFESADVSTKLTEGVRADHPLPFRVPVDRLLLEAVSRVRDPGVVRDAVGPTSYYAEPEDDYTERIQRLPLSLHDGQIASMVDGPIAIEELVIISGLPETEALRAILGLRLVGVLAPFYEKKVTDSGKLRMRQAAFDSGYAVDSATAAVALGFAAADDEDADARPVSMGELDGSGPHAAAPPASAPASAPVEPTHHRGDTGRLRLLSSAYLQMAETEAASGDFGAAAQCYESALAQKPGDLEVLLAYAAMHAKRPGGAEAAERLLEQARDGHPRSAAPRVALARLYNHLGRGREAREALSEARRLEPNNPDVLTLPDEQSKGGLFSKLKFRRDPPRAAAKPPAPAPPRPAPPRPAPAPQPAARPPVAGGTSKRRCRYCGRSFDHDVRACHGCGATL